MTSTDDPHAPPQRRRRRWAAFLLNLVLPPIGYVYAGAPRVALLALGIWNGAAVLAVIWTIADPPGIYGVLSLSPDVIVGLLAAACLLYVALALHTARLCRWPTAWRASGWRLWLTAIGLWILPLALGLTVRAFAPAAIYSVASQSMAPSLAAGDFVLSSGSRACRRHSPRPGDVILLRRGGRIYASRAIAGPGQIIAMRGGHVILDGRPVLRRQIGLFQGPPDAGAPLERRVVETLPDGAHYTIQEFEAGQPQDDLAPTKVPSSAWFALGDNRDNSRDSRFKGSVAEADICGVATKILYSRDAARIGARP